MKITQFEDIEGWKAARKLAQAVSQAIRNRSFGDSTLVRQMRKCTISAMANIAEGFDSGTDGEFVRFLRIACRSVTELQSHFYVALDDRFLEQPDFDALYAKAHETKAIIGGFIRYLKKSRPRL